MRRTGREDLAEFTSSLTQTMTLFQWRSRGSALTKLKAHNVVCNLYRDKHRSLCHSPFCHFGANGSRQKSVSADKEVASLRSGQQAACRQAGFNLTSSRSRSLPHAAGQLQAISRPARLLDLNTCHRRASCVMLPACSYVCTTLLQAQRPQEQLIQCVTRPVQQLAKARYCAATAKAEAQ